MTLAGPVPAGVYGAWLTAVGLWQVVFFVALRGWPFSTIRRRGPRLLTSNAVVIACGCTSYLVLRHPIGLEPGRIGAVCGAVITAVLPVGMLFEAWPGTLLGPLRGRTCDLILMGVVAALLYYALSTYARHVAWVRATGDEWVTFAAMNGLGMGVILHVAIWRRWPVVAGARQSADAG